MNIREAAKRLLDTDWPLGHVETGGVHEMQDEDYGDLQAVARYAARFEDDTPVDAEWLERVGFRFNVETGDHLIRSSGRVRLFVNAAKKQAAIMNPPGFCAIGVTIEYRGDVRKLCDVLGIELREDG